MEVRLVLYRDARIVTCIIVREHEIEFVRSEPGSDDLLRLKGADRLIFTSLMQDHLRRTHAKDDEPCVQPGDSGPLQDAVLTDRQIASTAHKAFGNMGQDPFDYVSEMARSAGLNAEFSTWSNI